MPWVTEGVQTIFPFWCNNLDILLWALSNTYFTRALTGCRKMSFPTGDVIHELGVAATKCQQNLCLLDARQGSGKIFTCFQGRTLMALIICPRSGTTWTSLFFIILLQNVYLEVHNETRSPPMWFMIKAASYKLKCRWGITLTALVIMMMSSA